MIASKIQKNIYLNNKITENTKLLILTSGNFDKIC